MRNAVRVAGWMLLAGGSIAAGALAVEIGREVAVARHLQDGEETTLGKVELIAHGKLLFDASWTTQEGAGRPLTKGTGAPLADPSNPLVFPRNFNRISGPDANACAGCHNMPRSGGGGDIVANVFVLGQRFDHATFDPSDAMPTVASHDEQGHFSDLDHIANSRATLGMFGSGYIEMLARQMTRDLQAQRDALAPGGSVRLSSKGIGFGHLARRADGSYDVSEVQGLPENSLRGSLPSLVLRPFHQAGAVVSLREFSNNAFNHHHGIQSEERFGVGADPDADGFVDEMTRADITAVTIYQATLAVPGRVIPRRREIEEAVLVGEQRFAAVGCAGCHVPELPLDDHGWFFVEPNPYNPPGNLRPGEAPDVVVNLNSPSLPGPRLRATQGVTWVPAYTDFKLHDITSGPDDPNREPLHMQSAMGSDPFFAGNGEFLTKKLWGVANEPPYFHHGKYTTMREAILAHAGEAQESADGFRALTSYEQDAVVEFLKSLQVLKEDAPGLVLDENGHERDWPPAWAR